MLNWMLFLIALVTVVVILAARGNRGARIPGHAHLRYDSSSPDSEQERQSIGVDDVKMDARKHPNLEYQGHVYFFCTVEERDICTANLQVRDFQLRVTTTRG